MTTEMKHTPGPWLYDGEGRVLTTRGRVRHVAEVEAPDVDNDLDGEHWEKVTSNGHLIAAAPDLLAALEGVLRVADRATAEFDAARAAVAKARGQT